MPHSGKLDQTLFSSVVVWRTTGTATWRTLLNIASCLILAQWPRMIYMQIANMTSSINRKYITYQNAVRDGPSQGHKRHAQKIWWSSAVRFSSYASGQTDKTNRQRKKQTDLLITIFHTPLRDERNKNLYTSATLSHVNSAGRGNYFDTDRPPYRDTGRRALNVWQLNILFRAAQIND